MLLKFNVVEKDQVIYYNNCMSNRVCKRESVTDELKNIKVKKKHWIIIEFSIKFSSNNFINFDFYHVNIGCR